MAKNKKRTNNKKTQFIIPLPKHSQQPRSTPPKRRTDFSNLTFSNLPSGSSPGSSSDEVRLSNVTASSLQGRMLTVKQLYDDTLLQCSNYQEDRPACLSEFSYVPVAEVDSAVQDGFALNCNRDAGSEKIDISKMSESTPHESCTSDSSSHAVTPGSVVWARTASQMWWPAEIMEERSALSDPGSDGHVLVQFYGNHPSSWIDPLTDISTFEDYFEERSNNPSEDFQQALKQAIKRKAQQLNSCQKFSPDRSTHSDQQDRSFDKCTSPSTSRTVDDFQERRRGKRERKPKVHFDEVTCPMKPERRVRRLKIMRYLGLAAPIGSPF